MSNSPVLCPNCKTALIGEYCHGCGQRRITGRLTVRAFIEDVARRVFRFDRMLAVTFWAMLRQIRYNLAEIYVFATYVFGTAGLLWAIVPIIDLLLPWQLGASAYVIVGVALGIELVYTSYAVFEFSGLPLWQSFVRVGAVLAVGYGVLAALVGVDNAVALLLPPMPS